MRVCTYTWPFRFGVRLGWATACTPNPDPRQARGRVYLLRGNAVVFSGGMGVLCDRLRGLGFWAEDLRCVGDRWAVHHLVTDHRAGRLHGPVVFVGHSCGGRYSLYAARHLERFGIPVDLVVCLDVALPLAVPANVRRAVGLSMSRWRLYPARPLRAEDPSSTALRNIDLSRADSPAGGEWLTHLTITDSAAVQDWIADEILAVSGQGRKSE
jgi:thioesterase domain-containing protein